ncbi:MAG: NAD-dependent epimerase/dehydratase family protein [Candidatus Schekmanbacteria bacterium]|nr:NAD-dependent epimerase/dehydratase family protein [Candidatus Schekmanbacteria bacterium]
MRVFMTGGTGFLGKAVTTRLIAAGHEVTLLCLPRESVAARAGLHLVTGDITRPDTLVGLFADHDAVVHLAGAVGYGQKMSVCLAVNRDGTRNVAAAAVAAGTRRFIHLSSVSVYGRVAGVPITENAPRLRTGEPYGDTKIDAEEVLEDFVARGELAVTMLRPTVIYGPGDEKFLPKLAQNLLSGKARIIGDGDNSVDLIHVDDVALIVEQLLRREDTIGAVFNVTNPDNCTWRELLAAVADELGVSPPRTRLPYGAALIVAGALEWIAAIRGKEPALTRYAVRVIGRQYYYVVDRLQRDLGFVPCVEVRDGVRECVRELAAAGRLQPGTRARRAR